MHYTELLEQPINKQVSPSEYSRHSREQWDKDISEYSSKLADGNDKVRRIGQV